MHNDDDVLVGHLLEGRCLTLEQIASACTVEPRWLQRLIDEDLFPPAVPVEGAARFSILHLRRARRMRDIEHTFDAEPELAALVADLLEEMDRLRARLHRAGLD